MKSMKSPLAEGTLVRSLLTLAGGAATLPLAVSPADAAVIVSDLSGTVIGWNTGAGQTPATTLVLPALGNINISTRANAAGGRVGGSGSFGVRLVGGLSAGVKFRKPGGGSSNQAYLAPAGATANAGFGSLAVAFINRGTGYGGDNNNKGNIAFSGSSKYLLFSFMNSGTTQTNFGWIEVTAATTGISSGKSTYSATLGSWAYDNTGAQITAGAVPEPSSATLFGGALVAGAVGLRRWRKQRATSVPMDDDQA